eukprot:403337538
MKQYSRNTLLVACFSLCLFMSFAAADDQQWNHSLSHRISGDSVNCTSDQDCVKQFGLHFWCSHGICQSPPPLYKAQQQQSIVNYESQFSYEEMPTVLQPKKQRNEIMNKHKLQITRIEPKADKNIPNGTPCYHDSDCGLGGILHVKCIENRCGQISHNIKFLE